MPELPDVAIHARYLDATALRRTVAATHVMDDRILAGVSQRQFAARLKRRELAATDRHGKVLFVRLDDGADVVLHFGMTGDLAAWRAGDGVPQHARLVWDLDDGGHLAYTCTRLLGGVGYTRDRDAFLAQQDLGPDALDAAVDGDWFVENLGGRRGTIKSALMNQSLLAGIGNVYSDEILFQAGILPAREVRDLDERDLRRIHRLLRRILRAAIDRGAEVEHLPRTWLVRHREEGAACPRCGQTVQTGKVGGRTSYWCDVCQE